MRAPHSSQGFTAVEMMVVIFIIALLAAFAAPNMGDLIRTQRVRGLSYDLFADLTFARSEAISRGHTVIMQSAGGNNWAGGWVIRDVTSGEMLRQEGARSRLLFQATAPSVTFDPTGRTSAGTISFQIMPDETSAPDNQKRCLRIDPSGRPRSTTGLCA